MALVSASANSCSRSSKRIKLQGAFEGKMMENAVSA